MSEQSERVLASFRTELNVRFNDLKAHSSALEEITDPHLTDFNKFCDSLRGIVRQTFGKDFGFKCDISTYDKHNDSILIEYTFRKEDKRLLIAVRFYRAGAEFEGNKYEYRKMEQLYLAISERVLNFYAAF